MSSPVAALVLTSGLLACASGVSAPVDLTVTVETRGPRQDPDGYLVSLDYHPGVPANVVDTIVFQNVGTVDHVVGVNGIAANCEVEGENPVSVSPDAGWYYSDMVVHFTVDCDRSAVLQVETQTTGSNLDPDGYTVWGVDLNFGYGVPTNGITSLPPNFPGAISVSLDGLAANCTLTSPSPLPVTLVADSTVKVAFQVSCS